MENVKLDKVIKEWEAVLSRDLLDAPWDLIDETLELLKERLPIAPKPIHASERWYSCGNCDCSITKDEDIYCPRCGRPINWS